MIVVDLLHSIANQLSLRVIVDRDLDGPAIQVMRDTPEGSSDVLGMGVSVPSITFVPLISLFSLVPFVPFIALTASGTNFANLDGLEFDFFGADHISLGGDGHGAALSVDGDLRLVGANVESDIGHAQAGSGAVTTPVTFRVAVKR